MNVDMEQFLEMDRHAATILVDEYMASKGIDAGTRATITLLFGGIAGMVQKEGGLDTPLADYITQWLFENHPLVLAELQAKMVQIAQEGTDLR